ncbi:hypothetical protein ABZX85_07435 [Streptomyces sp. NPDC004539]|uniref:hypothetical protein n=1 Tax=Streptomyces sp. NPDC004539 TaxID=3154280 RepID=UPI0033BF883D
MTIPARTPASTADRPMVAHAPRRDAQADPRDVRGVRRALVATRSAGEPHVTFQSSI